jgi:hypothetical protein
MRAKKKKIKDRYQNFKRALTLCVGSAVVVCGLFAVCDPKIARLLFAGAVVAF